MDDFDFDTPLTDQEWDTLEDFLLDQQDITPFTTLSALDGFLTAVVSGPEMIPPNEWLALVFGGDMEAPQWKSEEQPEVIIGLLLRLMNNIATVMSETPDYFSPLFMAYRDEELEDPDEDIIVVDEWCHGYIQGFILRREAWEGHEEALEAFIQPIFVFGTEEGAALIESLSDEDEKAIKDSIPDHALSIYEYWLEMRAQELEDEDFSFFDEPQEPFFRTMPKTGRNDPCPCGSGKKYKKCCGLN
jgi:uncharacterized protein